MSQSMSRLTFHVRHNARPDLIKAYLELIDDHPDTDDETLIEHGAARGSYIGTTVNSAQSMRENAAQYLRDFGMVEHGNNRLTDQGGVLCRILYMKPDIFAEVMHYMFYSTWRPQLPEQYCFSWSYATATTLLWSQSQAVIDLKRLANEVEVAASQRFTDAKVSLSDDSIRGVLHWLSPLKPEVIVDSGNTRHFSRRSFCPPELFVFAVDYVYQCQNIPYESNLLIDSDIQDMICRVCVLEPESFERVADYAVLQFSFLKRGMGGGWGNYLLLERAPTLQDVL
jgi:hypothetical protein